MRYILRYNPTLLLFKFMDKVGFPLQSFLTGLWYKAWGYPPAQQHVDRFKKMGKEQMEDFVFSSLKANYFAVFHAYLHHNLHSRSLKIAYRLERGLTACEGNFSLRLGYCETMIRYLRITDIEGMLRLLDDMYTPNLRLPISRNTLLQRFPAECLQGKDFSALEKILASDYGKNYIGYIPLEFRR